MATTSMDPWAWCRNQLETADADRLREMLSTCTSMLMNAEVEALCGDRVWRANTGANQHNASSFFWAPRRLRSARPAWCASRSRQARLRPYRPRRVTLSPPSAQNEPCAHGISELEPGPIPGRQERP